jgi:SAM-dependent methyltransferase
MRHQLRTFDQVLDHFASLDTKQAALLLGQDRGDTGLEPFFGRLPAETTQANYTGLSGNQAFLAALTFLEASKAKAFQLGQPFQRRGPRSVLDFGSGWGRVTQCLSLHFDASRIIGLDVTDEAIALCEESDIKATFAKVEPWPPTLLPSASVDFIFSYSVFSHLSEDNADAWIREFARILAPGGVAFLTTRHRSFFSYLEQLHAAGEVPGFAAGASLAFRDINKARADYDSGLFCFDPMGRGGAGLTPVYGEAFIPSQYVSRVYSRYFTYVGFEEPQPGSLLDQATICLRK